MLREHKKKSDSNTDQNVKENNHGPCCSLKKLLFFCAVASDKLTSVAPLSASFPADEIARASIVAEGE